VLTHGCQTIPKEVT